MMDLRAEISKPAYAALVAANDWAGVAIAVNAASLPVPSPDLVTDRTIMARLAPTVARGVLAKLKAVATLDPLVEHAYLRIKGDGLDLSHANAQAQIDALASDQVPVEVRLTAEERDALKALGFRPYVCTARDVIVVAFNADGSRAV